MRITLVAANLAVLGLVATFVVGESRSATSSGSGAVALNAVAKTDDAVAGPLDQISAVDIAVNVARAIDLPEQHAVTSQSDSAKVTTVIAPADTSVIAKPQVVVTNQKSVEDVKEYMAVDGDTVAGVAAKFGVTSNSIRWSNNDIVGETLTAGRTLVIPPIDGIVYTVKAGDTIDALADTYRINKAQLVAFNDAEVNGIQPNQRIVIPGGQKPAPVAVAVSTPSYSSSSGFSAQYGYNGYDPGWCTWYVATRISVPSNWGNANTWDDRARMTSGWTVSQVPQIGAVAQSNAGWAGHVGIVEDVKIENGEYYIKYSDMNGLAGFNRVGYSEWVPAIGKYQNFIYQ